MCLRRLVFNIPLQDIRSKMTSLDQKEVKKKTILTRNDEKVGMWAVQSRKTAKRMWTLPRRDFAHGNWKKEVQD